MHHLPVPRSRRTMLGFTLIELIVVMIIMGVLVAVAGSTFASMRRAKAVQPHLPTSQAPAQPAHPIVQAPAAVAHSGGVPTFVWIGLIVFIVLLVAGFEAWRFVPRQRDDKAAREQVKAASVALGAALRARHDKVITAWMDYREDIGKLLAMPALNDVSIPATGAFYDALGRAQDLEPRDGANAPVSSDYESAVRLLERTWTAALANARRVGTGLMSADERKKIQQAVSLLAIARDSGASASERSVAYERVVTLLHGIIEVPKEAVAAIEAAVRKQLTAV